LAVAEERHFTRAAERFGITQPPLSQQIHLLQQEMGHLCSAASRGVELTDAGAVLLEETRRILAQAGRAGESMQSRVCPHIGARR